MSAHVIQRVVRTNSSPDGHVVRAVTVGPSIVLNGSGMPAASDAETIAGTATNRTVTPFALQRKLPTFVPDGLAVSAIQTAATAAAAERGKVIVPAGDYTVDSALTLVSHSYQLWEPGVRLLIDTHPTANAILAQGTEGAPAALGTDAAAGDYQITLPAAHGIVVNDMIGFISDEVVIAGTPGVRAREIHQVVAVVGNDVFLDEPLWWTYQVAESGEFWKITPVVDVHIEGNFTMEYASAPGEEVRGIVISRALRATVHATSVDGPGIFVGDSIGVDVEAYIDGDAVYADYRGYAMSDAGSGHSNHFKGRARNCRHGFTTLPIEDLSPAMWAGPYGSRVEVDAWGGEESFAPLDTHAGAVGVRFVSCKGRGTGQASTPGLQDRGYQTSIEGGSFSGGESGVVFADGAIGGKLSGARVATRPTSTDAAIGLFGDDLTVTDCDIEALAGYAFDTTGSNHKITENRIKALVPVRDNTSGMLVARNHIDMDVALYAFDSAQNTYQDNHYHGGVSASVIFNSPNVGARLQDGWHAPITLPWAATITPNPCFINSLAFPVEGNTTIANPAAGNKVTGARLRLLPTWDATGGWTITFGSDFVMDATLDRAPNAATVLEFAWDGTKWRLTTSSTRRQDLFGTAPAIEGVAGEYWAPPAIRGPLATGDGILYTKRIYVPVDTPIDRIGAHVTTGVAATTITLGYYADDGTGDAPGALLFDAGTIDGNSATAQEITISQILRGGRYYWEAALADGGGPTLRFDLGTAGVGYMGRYVNLATAVGTTLVNQGRFRTGVAGTALPDPAATTTLLSAMPTVAVRLA